MSNDTSIAVIKANTTFDMTEELYISDDEDMEKSDTLITFSSPYLPTNRNINQIDYQSDAPETLSPKSINEDILANAIKINNIMNVDEDSAPNEYFTLHGGCDLSNEEDSNGSYHPSLRSPAPYIPQNQGINLPGIPAYTATNNLNIKNNNVEDDDDNREVIFSSNGYNIYTTQGDLIDGIITAIQDTIIDNMIDDIEEGIKKEGIILIAEITDSCTATSNDTSMISTNGTEKLNTQSAVNVKEIVPNIILKKDINMKNYDHSYFSINTDERMLTIKTR